MTLLGFVREVRTSVLKAGRQSSRDHSVLAENKHNHVCSYLNMRLLRKVNFQNMSKHPPFCLAHN